MALIPRIAAAATRFGAAGALAWMVTFALVVPTGTAWRDPLVLAFVGGSIALWTVALVAVCAPAAALLRALFRGPAAPVPAPLVARTYGIVLLAAAVAFVVLRPGVVDGWLPEYVTRREPIVLVVRSGVASAVGFIAGGLWIGLRHRHSMPVGLLAAHYVAARIVLHDAVWRSFEPNWWLLDAGGLVLLTLGFAGAFAGDPPAWRRRLAGVCAAAAGLCIVVVLGVYGRSGAPRAALREAYPAAADMIRLVQARMDLDGDGFAAWLGGLDCDDSDPSVSPVALEIVGNGVDDNCAGGDLGHAPAAPPEPRRDKSVPKLNVVLLSVDALRADMVTSEAMPHLRAFAERSAHFTRAYAQASFTDNSVRSLMSGRYPWDFDTGFQFFGQEPSMAELLAAARFQTHAIKVNVLLTPYAFQGFTRVDDEISPRNKAHDAVTGDATADKAIAALDELSADGHAFFLWAHFFDAHADYVAHEGTPIAGDDDAARYRQEVWFTDRQLGRVLDHLRAAGLLERSIVVVTADHGELIGERGRYGHAYWLDEGVLRVPLIVHAPGVPAGELATRVRLIDVYPTVLRLAAGIDAASDGHDLAEVWDGTDVEDRDVFARTTYGEARLRAGIVGDHKLVVDLVHGTERLYDLAQTPARRKTASTPTPSGRSACGRRSASAGTPRSTTPCSPASRRASLRVKCRPRCGVASTSRCTNATATGGSGPRVRASKRYANLRADGLHLEGLHEVR